MKKPYKEAYNLPFPSLLLRKNETVIGTIGNTQGVSKATNPHAIASRITAQIDFPPSFLLPDNFSPPSAAATTAPSAAGNLTVSSSSVGGRQLPSLQVCHSTVTFAVTASAEATSTFCAICTPESQVPISIPNISS